jgi:hypothetical protein
MSESISVVREIATTSDRVWELVSDLPRMGEWSDENTGGEWLDGARGPAVGARFRGTNRNGDRRWKTLATVTECDPGHAFAFDVSAMGLPISTWSYRLAPSGDGCTVTETWTDRRPGFFKPIAKLATGVGDRAAHTRRGMEYTLERLAATAEAESAQEPG